MGSPAASPQTEEFEWSRFWTSVLWDKGNGTNQQRQMVSQRAEEASTHRSITRHLIPSYLVVLLCPGGMGRHLILARSQPQYGSRERMHSLQVSP